MAQNESFGQRWEKYRPSKALWFWSCIGVMVLTMVIGFSVGGWVTGGTARTMAQDASQDVRSELVASLCVNKFVNATNAQGRLVKLKDASSYKRDNIIEDGGWLKIAGVEDTGSDAAELCAEKLVAMDKLPERTAQPVSPSAPKKETSDG